MILDEFTRNQMLKFHAKISQIKFDDKTYLRDLDRYFRRTVREAAREWLIAVLNAVKTAKPPRHTVGDSFPISTGEAKGSLVPLGRRLHIAVPISPAPGREDRSSIGIQKGSFEVPTTSSAGPNTVQSSYVFNFESGVAHFELLESNKANPKSNIRSKTPWHAILAGDIALQKFLDKNLFKNAPRVNSYFFVSERS